AGYIQLTEGTAPSLVANTVQHVAATDAPAGGIAYVWGSTAAGSGILRVVNSSGTMTVTQDAGISNLASSTSASLATVLSDETGSGVAVFGTSPTFTTQITSPKVVWSGSVQDLTGSGTPEGNVAAAIGSVYRRTDGGSSTTLYVKESGSGNTGWVAYGP